MEKAAGNYVKTGFFALAMAFMEAAVVIYLRALYYPEGFAFPLAVMAPGILMTEIIREIASIIMIISVAYLASGDFYGRFAAFLYIFALWDIFYYVFLKALILWPVSLLEWDLLFLIPVPWLGPVLAPLICSFTMIALAVLIEAARCRFRNFRIKFFEWVFLCTGAFIVFMSFIKNSSLVTEGVPPPGADFMIPAFGWDIFVAGEILIIISMIFISRRILYEKK